MKPAKNDSPRAFVRGRIVTSYGPLRIVGGLVVNNNEVIYAGDPSTASSIAKMLGGEIIDLKGKWVIPGFVDSHIHLDGLGLNLRGLDLSNVCSISLLREKLRRYAERSADQVIYGRGWDQECFDEARWPRRSDIDNIVDDRPVVLVRKCGHVALLNSIALDRIMEIGVPEDLLGHMQVEEGGPTGLIFEDLVYYALRVLLEQYDYREVLLEASRHLASLGVTSVGFMSASPKMYRSLLQLDMEGLLRTRVHIYFDHKYMNDVLRSGISMGEDCSKVIIRGVKTYADGSLGSRTAYLLEDYADSPGKRGLLIRDKEKLKEFMEKSWENILQPAVHAIGDGAILETIKAYEEAGKKEPGLRIEHASLSSPLILDELARNNILVSIQPMFIVSDWWAQRRLGDRIKYLYPYRSMLVKGVILGLSSDSPVETPDPRMQIYAAETRGIKKKSNRQCVECITRLEALHAYTWGSSRLLLNDKIGCLSKGCKADFIVTSTDPFSLDDIRRLSWEMVFLGGYRIY